MGVVLLTLTIVKELQPEKADPPMLVTLSGMVMEVRLVQCSKASLPMVVTLLGMVTEVRP